MKLTYMLLLISSMFMRENHNGNKANIIKTWRTCQPCTEEKRALHKDIFCWPHAVLWLDKIRRGYQTVLVGLFLYLVVNEWTTLCVATLQEKWKRRRTVTPLVKTCCLVCLVVGAGNAANQSLILVCLAQCCQPRQATDLQRIRVLSLRTWVSCQGLNLDFPRPYHGLNLSSVPVKNI